MPGRPWTRDEVLVAFNLYCRTPFGRLHARNSEIIRIAQMLGRTPSALAMKCCNIASFDPALQERGVKGLRKAARLDREVWESFEQDPERLGFESEVAFARAVNVERRTSDKIEWEDIEGLEREAVTKVRVNQHLFRSIVLSGYRGMCAVCQLPMVPLLVASHIVPWSTDKLQRMNPRNGICLCSLHDRAFDTGILHVQEDYTICFDESLKEFGESEVVGRFFTCYEGMKIQLPDRWYPDPLLLKRREELTSAI